MTTSITVSLITLYYTPSIYSYFIGFVVSTKTSTFLLILFSFLFTILKIFLLKLFFCLPLRRSWVPSGLHNPLRDGVVRILRVLTNLSYRESVESTVLGLHTQNVNLKWPPLFEVNEWHHWPNDFVEMTEGRERYRWEDNNWGRRGFIWWT